MLSSEEKSKPIAVSEFDTSTPIDAKKAIEQFGGMRDMFYMMLEKFEDMTLLPTMQAIAQDINEKDFSKLKNDAHSLKGASGYVGAGHLHYACYFI